MELGKTGLEREGTKVEGEGRRGEDGAGGGARVWEEDAGVRRKKR